VAETPVIKHWIITAFTPGVDPSLDDSTGGATWTTTVDGTVIGGTVVNALYPDSKSAMDAAREAATLNPGVYYVVYEAMWWSHTYPVPVHLAPVIGVVGAGVA
jgi:hypothetical protein